MLFEYCYHRKSKNGLVISYIGKQIGCKVGNQAGCRLWRIQCHVQGTFPCNNDSQNILIWDSFALLKITETPKELLFLWVISMNISYIRNSNSGIFTTQECKVLIPLAVSKTIIHYAAPGLHKTKYLSLCE